MIPFFNINLNFVQIINKQMESFFSCNRVPKAIYSRIKVINFYTVHDAVE